MIDINLLRKEKEKVRAELKKRNKEAGIVDDILKVDKDKRELLSKIEEQKARQNSFSEKIHTLSGQEKQQNIIEMKAVSERIKEQEPKLKKIEKEYSRLMSSLPNISHPSVVTGKDDASNEVEKKWGEIPKFDFKPKSHIELGEELDVIDIKRGVKVSGNRFYYLKGDLVRLEHAIIQYLFDLLAEKGFTLLNVPVLVKEKALYGTGFFPAEKNEIYNVNPEDDDLYLIGTSEVSLASYHADEILEEEDLPKKYFAFSSCFRREAGAYGRDTKGIFRVHQFEKVEMFQLIKEEDSWREYEKMLEIFEEILQRLEIPYQRVLLSTGDISQQSAKTTDLEGWFPSQEKYRELGSGSNTTTFQSRRLNIRYQDKNKKKHFAHLMNCTAAAMPRLLICILENYQQKDGSVIVPQVLRPYFSGKDVIKKSNS
ncbi:serine--tRNA ligase [Patescibacteria group bacterium]|nr:serine--tRNA ligase [Patescibacteria group bacterium]